MSINDFRNLNYNLNPLDPQDMGKSLEPNGLPNYELDTFIFVDAAIASYGQILYNINPSAGVILLDSDSDGIEQIGEILSNYNNINAVHIISHGSEGTVKLGSTILSNANLSQYAGQIQEWGTALTNTADILFYGCNVAQSEDGQAFINQISQITGADVAASTDKTGASFLGGDWELEFETGAIEATKIEDNNYNHILASPWTVQDLYQAWQDGTPNDFSITNAEITINNNVFISGNFNITTNSSW